MTELEENYIKQAAQKVKERDIQKVINKGGQILSKLVGRSLGRFFQDAKLLLSLVRDYLSKNIDWSLTGVTTIKRGQFAHLLTKSSVAWEGLPR